MRLGRAVLAYRGTPKVDTDGFEDAADMLCGLATLHELAHLVLKEKAAHFFRYANSQNFVTEYLPKVIERLYSNNNALTRKIDRPYQKANHKIP